VKSRNVVVTGGNSGIGKETAVALAASGDRVIIACRNAEKAAAALADISARSGSDQVETVALDLASFASIRACARELERRFDRVDVLVNNAGLVLSQRDVTYEGFEMTFGVNYLGPFLLTQELEGLITAAPAPRVINVSSLLHRLAMRGLPWKDLQSVRYYNGWIAYANSKLANLYFSQLLARRWHDAGVCVSSLHPGVVNTNFAGEGDTTGLVGRLTAMGVPGMLTPTQGADTSVWLATGQAGGDLTQSGRHWSRRKHGVLSRIARKSTEAARLWAVTEDLVRINSM
jgi:NAD(P)-dependent dehydrogenase (short-subunit alcohol dehydrogenase family)